MVNNFGSLNGDEKLISMQNEAKGCRLRVSASICSQKDPKFLKIIIKKPNRHL